MLGHVRTRSFLRHLEAEPIKRQAREGGTSDAILDPRRRFSDRKGNRSGIKFNDPPVDHELIFVVRTDSAIQRRAPSQECHN
mmetsp:Transcript_77156/g.214570  ORF Transcript_77156/g.214570 Transcript_77156/m.214570 type:complete len:82 (-) Transcript_77156:22-267(-)